MPTCRCSGCGREYTQPLARMVDLLRRGRTGCQMCGADLVFPDEAAAALGGGDAAPDMAALTKYTCGACDATWVTSPTDLASRRNLGCKICGAPLRAETLAALDALAPARPIETDRVQFECFLCLRNTWVESPSPEDIYPCQFCGAGLRPPPLAEPPARREDVETAFGDLLRGSDLLAFAKEALLARVDRDDVGASEARRLAGQLAAIARWRADDSVPFLPLSLVEAEEAVPPIFYPGKHVFVERYEDRSDIVFTISASDGKSHNKAATINAIGFATLAFAGAGIFALGGDSETETDDQHRVRIGLEPEGARGVTLAFATQLNNERPKPLGKKASAGFAELVASQGDMLRAYYGMLAVFGAWTKGAAAAATVPAITKRLEHLGLGARALHWAERLCLERVRNS